MLKVQVKEEEEGALSLHEKLKKTSLTVASLEAALKMKAAETREIEDKNAGDSWALLYFVLLYDVTRWDWKQEPRNCSSEQTAEQRQGSGFGLEVVCDQFDKWEGDFL